MSRGDKFKMEFVEVALLFIFIRKHRLYCFIDAGNGLVPNWRQAIIWIKDYQVYWQIYASIQVLAFVISY